MFSKSELKEVGIANIRMAKNNGISIDLLRKTKNPENVEQLKPIAKDILNLKKTAGIQYQSINQLKYMSTGKH